MKRNNRRKSVHFIQFLGFSKLDPFMLVRRRKVPASKEIGHTQIQKIMKKRKLLAAIRKNKRNRTTFMFQCFPEIETASWPRVTIHFIQL